MRLLCLLLVMVLAFPASVPAQEDKAVSEQRAALEKERNLRILQRRIYAAAEARSALRQGIRTLQSLGFYIEQAYPLENVVRGIHVGSSDLVCALRIKELPDQPGKVQVWFNLQFEEKSVEDPQPYATFFKTFGPPSVCAAKGETP